MKYVIVNIAKKSPLFRRFIRFIFRKHRGLIYKYYMRKYEVNETTILFESFNGKSYACSPKAIYEKMITMKRFKNYKFIWAFDNTQKHHIKKNKNTIIVKHDSPQYLKYLATAKYWMVTNPMCY